MTWLNADVIAFIEGWQDNHRTARLVAGRTTQQVGAIDLAHFAANAQRASDLRIAAGPE